MVIGLLYCMIILLILMMLCVKSRIPLSESRMPISSNTNDGGSLQGLQAQVGGGDLEKRRRHFSTVSFEAPQKEKDETSVEIRVDVEQLSDTQSDDQLEDLKEQQTQVFTLEEANKYENEAGTARQYRTGESAIFDAARKRTREQYTKSVYVPAEQPTQECLN